MNIFNVLALTVFANVAVAEAPESSLRPTARTTQAEVGLVTAGPLKDRLAELRPKARPATAPLLNQPVAQALTSEDLAANTAGVATRASWVTSLRPIRRPARIEHQAAARKRARRKGAVCGDPDLQGEPVGRVPGRISGCGVKNAVRLKSVLGVSLSQTAVMDCTTAKALKRWIRKGVKPAFGKRGGGVARLRVAAHYACRTRNNLPGAKISEHGKGRAIDISAFQLRDGTVVTVLKGWRSGRDGRALKRIHKAACGPFGTVLGPNADRYHQDHFHMDTARYRSGSYCR